MSDVDETEPERTHYHFRISLRVRHPSMAPEKITEALGIEPSHSWKAGAPRQTPKGTPLDGFYEVTYWTARMVAGRWPVELNDAIHNTLKTLVPYRSFLHHLRAEGGRAELFIGWFFENQSGEDLTYQCLALAGDLKIDLSFDIYPPEQPYLNKPPLPI
jgi:hypothetical protein